MTVAIGQVYDWVGGYRLKVASHPNSLGLWPLDDAYGMRSFHYSHEIVHDGVLTKVQPDQTWQHDSSGLVIRIVDLGRPQFPGDLRWSVREDEKPEQTPTIFPESYLLTAFRLIDLPDIFAHGTQECPRCHSGRALVLMNLVACVNESCPCYTTRKVLVP